MTHIRRYFNMYSLIRRINMHIFFWNLRTVIDDIWKSKIFLNSNVSFGLSLLPTSSLFSTISNTNIQYYFLWINPHHTLHSQSALINANGNNINAYIHHLRRLLDRGQFSTENSLRPDHARKCREIDCLELE